MKVTVINWKILLCSLIHSLGNLLHEIRFVSFLFRCLHCIATKINGYATNGLSFWKGVRFYVLWQLDLSCTWSQPFFQSYLGAKKANSQREVPSIDQMPRKGLGWTLTHLWRLCLFHKSILQLVRLHYLGVPVVFSLPSKLSNLSINPKTNFYQLILSILEVHKRRKKINIIAIYTFHLIYLPVSPLT